MTAVTDALESAEPVAEPPELLVTWEPDGEVVIGEAGRGRSASTRQGSGWCPRAAVGRSARSRQPPEPPTETLSTFTPSGRIARVIVAASVEIVTVK